MGSRWTVFSLSDQVDARIVLLARLPQTPAKINVVLVQLDTTRVITSAISVPSVLWHLTLVRVSAHSARLVSISPRLVKARAWNVMRGSILVVPRPRVPFAKQVNIVTSPLPLALAAQVESTVSPMLIVALPVRPDTSPQSRPVSAPPVHLVNTS